MIEYIYIESSDIDRQINTKQLDEVLTWSLLMNCCITDNYVLMRLDDEIIGYIMYDESHIYKIEINDYYRKQGFGTRLLEEFESNRSSFDYNTVSLSVLNDDVCSFYERLDYKSCDKEHYTKNI